MQLYADGINGAEPFCQNLERGVMLAGAKNAYVYQGNVATSQPASVYTPRIVPAHLAAIVPLEANFIVWYR